MPSLSATHIQNRERVQPNDANNYESLHGGILTKWMDEVGAMSAMRFAGETCVTASIDELSFDRPIPLGDVALVEAYVYDAGETSVRVRVRASREDPRTGEVERTTASCFTFVAVDEDGRPVSVPDLTVESETERELQAQAQSE
ncbi:MAG: acyl-CoA hydrolase [Natronomonas sp.]|jgi:acyl-CoA hydrolase